MEFVAMAFWAPMTVALAAIVLGLLPDQEPALYLASVVLFLFMDAWLLLMLVTAARARNLERLTRVGAALPARGTRGKGSDAWPNARQPGVASRGLRVRRTLAAAARCGASLQPNGRLRRAVHTRPPGPR
jgi:hypothetical protein